MTTRAAGQLMRSLPGGFAALAVLLAMLFASTLALAACADARTRAHVYWTTREGDIGRANLDGTGVQRHFISGAAIFPSAVAVSGRHIYWVDTTGGRIGRANLDGTGVNRNFLSFQTSVFSPHDVVVRGGYVYWANWSGFIGRAKIDGTRVRLRFIAVKYFAAGYLAATSHHLYWTGLAYEEPNVIGRAALDGTGVRNSFIQSETSPFHLAADGRHLYWSAGANSIIRANLDGTHVRPKFIISDKGWPGGIAIGGGRVYWSVQAYSSTDPVEDTLQGWIGRAGLDGKGVRWIAVGSGEEAPTDVAVGPGAKSVRAKS